MSNLQPFILRQGSQQADSIASELAWDGLQFSTQAVAAALTLSLAQISGAATVILNTTGSASENLTTPSAQQIVQYLQTLFGFLPPVGFSFTFEINNTGSGTMTLVGGSGVTVTGTATTAATTNRTYAVTITANGGAAGQGPFTVTFQNVASRSN